MNENSKLVKVGFDDILNEIFGSIQNTSKLSEEFNAPLNSNTIKGTLENSLRAQMNVFEFQTMFIRYSTYPLKEKKYNDIENDFEYEIEMPVYRFGYIREGLFKNGWKWIIELMTIHLKYLLNRKKLFYTVTYTVSFLNAGMITFVIQETFDKFDPYVDINAKIIFEKLQNPVRVLSKRDTSHIISDQDYKWEVVSNGSYSNSVKTNHLNYYKHGDRRFILHAKSNNDIVATVQVFVHPILAAPTIHLPLHHWTNLSRLIQEPFPIKVLDSFLKPRDNLFTREGKRLFPHEDRWDQNVSEIYYPSKKRIPDRTKEGSERYRVRTLPHTRGFSMDKLIVSEPQSLYDENFIGMGDFTLVYFGEPVTKKSLIEKLTHFTKTVMDDIPMTGFYLGKDDLLFGLIDKATSLSATKKMMSSLRTEWKNIRDLTISQMENGEPVENVLEWFWKQMITILNPNPAIRTHLLDTYFGFTARLPVDDVSRGQIGTYLHQWIRNKNSRQAPRDILETIEVELLKHDFQYHYYYVPDKFERLTFKSINIGPQSILIPIKKQLNPLAMICDGYECKQVEIVNERVEFMIMSRDNITFPSNNLITITAGNFQLWVINRVRLGFDEIHYIQFQEIMNYVVTIV